MAKITTIESGYYRIPLPQVLTDSMHGEIYVTSRPAKGSTFTVTLPLSPT